MPINPILVKEENSELEKILYKNAYIEIGLTKEEHKRALHLIRHPVFCKDDCWVCKTTYTIKERVGKAIYDTGLCQGHALYALATRK
ncbi:hypothetical protein J4433_00330 [Candidatus Pacearchaeota archaeon]|nr:hypothetical protein [Candidatus Pacearchaeota archaeon]